MIELDQQRGLLEALAHSPAGLFREPADIFSGIDAPQIAISRIRGDLRHLKMPEGVHCAMQVQAGGAALTKEEARLRAIAEAVERYAASVYSDDQFIVAAAEELSADCLDLDSIPRCSATELSDFRCPLISPDKQEPIRWVKAVSLAERRTCWVPAIMVYSYLADIRPSERFWFPISTGCAAHFSLEKAILSGLCEVIERDAISMTWLHELHLPRIVFDCEVEQLKDCWDMYEQSTSAVEFEFYDATTDMGIPTVYGLRISTERPYARTMVACSTATSMVEAIKKVFCDLVSIGTLFTTPPEYPDDFANFRDLLHGAAYMADERRESAFEFLRNNGKRVLLGSLIRSMEPPSDVGSLTEWLRVRGLTPLVVDITPDEARAVGMNVVRVIVPQLQPLSFHHLARFLGTPRLYEAQLPGGRVTRAESELNALPQPFA